MSDRKLRLNTQKGSLRDRSDAYQVLAKENRDKELAKKRGLTHAPIGRMQPELKYQQTQQELLEEQQRREKEAKNMQMLEDKEKKEIQEKIRQRQEEQEEEARMNEIDTRVKTYIVAQSKKREQTLIEEVIENSTRYNDNTKWLLIDGQKWYKVGTFIRKHDFTQSGLYLPREDYHTFNKDSDILVFYEFSNAVLSDHDLVGKFFKRDERSNYPNFDATRIDTSTRTMDLNNKKAYVKDTRFFMINAIIQYLNTKPWLNKQNDEVIPPVVRGFASDDDKDYSHSYWSQQIQAYINFYEQIVPMVQRYLENNPDNVLITVGTNVKNKNNGKMGKITSIYTNDRHNITYDNDRERAEKEIRKDDIQIIGNIDNAIRQLDWIQETIKTRVHGYTLENYMTGKYIDSIKRLLSPAAEAPVIQTAAPVIIPTAGPSASAAPESVFSSWGNFPGFVSTAASYLGDKASGAASYLGNAAKSGVGYLGNAASYGVGSAANALRATTGFPQDSKGMMFAKGKAPSYTPPVAQLSHADDMAVSGVYKDLELRRGERADYYGDTTKYRGPYDYRYPSNIELMNTSKQIVGERKAAAADANKMPVFSFGGPKFGGKRKSKRKQTRSQKQKKSRKQRR